MFWRKKQFDNDEIRLLKMLAYNYGILAQMFDCVKCCDCGGLFDKYYCTRKVKVVGDKLDGNPDARYQYTCRRCNEEKKQEQTVEQRQQSVTVCHGDGGIAVGGLK